MGEKIGKRAAHSARVKAHQRRRTIPAHKAGKPEGPTQKRAGAIASAGNGARRVFPDSWTAQGRRPLYPNEKQDPARSAGSRPVPNPYANPAKTEQEDRKKPKGGRISGAPRLIFHFRVLCLPYLAKLTMTAARKASTSRPQITRAAVAFFMVCPPF